MPEIASCECCGTASSPSSPIYWHGVLRVAVCRRCRANTDPNFVQRRLRQILAGQTARAVTRTLMAAAS